MVKAVVLSAVGVAKLRGECVLIEDYGFRWEGAAWFNQVTGELIVYDTSFGNAYIPNVLSEILRGKVKIWMPFKNVLMDEVWWELEESYQKEGLFFAWSRIEYK